MKSYPKDYPADLTAWPDSQTIQHELGRRVLFALIGENAGNQASRKRTITTRFGLPFPESEWLYRAEDNAPGKAERYKMIKYEKT